MRSSARFGVFLAALAFAGAANFTLVRMANSEAIAPLKPGDFTELIEEMESFLALLDRAIGDTEERALLGGGSSVDRIKLNKLKEQRNRILELRSNLSEELEGLSEATE